MSFYNLVQQFVVHQLFVKKAEICIQVHLTEKSIYLSNVGQILVLWPATNIKLVIEYFGLNKRDYRELFFHKNSVG